MIARTLRALAWRRRAAALRAVDTATATAAETALDANLARRKAERLAAQKANTAREIERLRAHRIAMQAAMERRR